jgi:hypothetical protein
MLCCSVPIPVRSQRGLAMDKRFATVSLFLWLGTISAGAEIKVVTPPAKPLPKSTLTPEAPIQLTPEAPIDKSPAAQAKLAASITQMIAMGFALKVDP